MKKLSVKLGILFFFIIFGLVTFMFFFLHNGITQSRVEEELSSLQKRGNSHRDILEKHFDLDTIDHVVLMESEAETDVVITNQDGQVLNSSAPPEVYEKYLKVSLTSLPSEGRVIEGNWEDEPYISTVSPIQKNDQLVGLVYMFQDTTSVHSMMKRLNEHFVIAGWISVIFTIVIIIFLSKGITKPLLRMKEATSQISKGNYSVSLPNTYEDELGDLAKSIETLARDLQYLTKQRNEFLASISHELRTPLTYIKGYADILRKQSLPKEEMEKYLTIIVEEANRLTQLVKELFELAKLDQNQFAIVKQPIDLHPFFEKMERQFLPIFQENSIDFTVNCPPNLYVMADPLRLEQILFNLLDNSKKYSPNGSKVVLRAWNHKNKVHILVQDHGKGIPEQDLPFIFNRFYRVDKARSRSLGGSGLGLAIVRELVHAHGADITVNSKENSGTCFEIIFSGGPL
ncbi:ATP-binding protein [Niallia oryzisoli]|uniref:sensor histidine kinase n=1 Tax=Niallia oryzisoli TaxID=1737571 RepID=UPI0037367CAD